MSILLLDPPFSPLDLHPALWLRADRGVLTDGAAAFVAASSQYLDIASSASFQMASTSFTLAGVFNFTALPGVGGEYGLIAKWTSGVSREYYLGLLNTGGTTRFELVVRDTGDTTNTTLQATTFGALSSSTTYKVIAGLDTTNNLLFIEVNGVRDTVSYSSGIRASTNNFTIGALSTGASFTNGTIDSVGVWKHAFSASEATAWAAGMRYPDLTGSFLTNLIAFYDFASLAAITTDASGNGKTLSNHSATFTTGLVSGSAINGDVESTWNDQSGNARNATQSTASQRPILEIPSNVNSLAGSRFDGVDDYMTLGNVAGFFSAAANEWSVFALLKFSTVASARQWVLARDSDTLGRANGGGILANKIYSEFNGSPKATGSIVLSTGSVYVLEWHQSGSGNTFEQRVNGTIDGSGTAGIPGASTAPIYVGGRAYSGVLDPMGADLAQLIGYPRCLSASEKTQVRTYLQALGGI